MKYLQTACVATLIGLSSNVYAATNGINYDPAHNPDWTPAQGRSDVNKMKQIITADLKQIKAMGFDVIKTYFSTYCTPTAGLCVDNIAELADTAGLKIMLGVFEFTSLQPGHPQGCNSEPECQSWTVPQTLAAIKQAQKFPNTVIGIVVGNEDIYNDNGELVGAGGDNLAQRIVNDIGKIRKGCDENGQNCQAVSVPMTTAQRQPDWCGGSDPGCAPDRTNSINQTNPARILQTISVIGVNIFPYWSPNFIPEKTGCNGQSMALCTQTTAQNVLNAVKKVSGTTVNDTIVTEEGWPSCYSTSSQHPTDASLEDDYFTNWLKHENQVFDSYYFMAYDLGKSKCPPQNGADANNYFGLCDFNGASKAGLSISCPHGALTAPRRVR